MRYPQPIAFVIAIVLLAAGAPAVAQQSDIGAIERRYEEALARRDLTGALAEANRLEAVIKARLGVDHPNYGAALHQIADVYSAQGRYGEAQALFERALAIRERALGAASPALAPTINNLGVTYQNQGRYAEAEAVYRRALANYEPTLGAGHAVVTSFLNNLGTVARRQGKFGEAEEVLKRALAQREQALGAAHPDVAQTLNNLALAYQDQGRYAEAEALYQRALQIRERAQGASHPALTRTLHNLAAVQAEQGKYAEAERLIRRALGIDEAALGANHPEVASTLNLLAAVLERQGRPDEAESLYKRTLALGERGLGAGHPSVARTLTNLAIVQYAQRRYGDAEATYQRALSLLEQSLGPRHPDVARTAHNLAYLYRDQKRFGDAEPLYKRALAIREQTLGADHPDLASTLDDLAALDAARGNAGDALAWSRRTTAAVLAHAERESAGGRQLSGPDEPAARRVGYLQRHLAHLAVAARRGSALDTALGGEGLEIAQWATQSAAAAALQQMAVRFAAGDGALAQLLREGQDLSALRRLRDKSLLDMLAAPDTPQNRGFVAELRKTLAEVDGRLAAVRARLDGEFPDYAALAGPKPVKADELRQLLGADEALVFWLVGEGDAKETYVFAATRDNFAWATLPLVAADLTVKVTAFRRGLDVDELQKSVSAGKPVLFDLALAHELYAALLGPVDDVIKGKAQLLVVPTGALTALPVHLLLTAKSEAPPPTVDNVTAYRDAAWLLKRQGVTVLPSVASLKALRLFARKDQATKPLVGFGDPIFGPEAGAAAQRGAKKAAARKLNTRSFTEFWQGAGVDRAKLAAALPRLEDTADELKAVAQKLGVAAGDIFLRADANESTVKRLALADYRVVYFATHGLVAGDVKGLAEPSLALTIPKQASETDDGLLTASEIAQLKLNADWVVLSACNTISGDKAGAEALSGLARAFFYAGARALLVSHWAVDSAAATRLTTSTFDLLKADPKLGRAEAMRRAMLAYVNDPSDPNNAYPAYWAPFSIVGEGAAR